MTNADAGALLLLVAIGAALWVLFGWIWMAIGITAYIGVCLLAGEA